MPSTVDRITETLNTIRTEPWLTATLEPNRQFGGDRRNHLAKMIESNLVNLNRNLVEAALHLREWDLISDAAKQRKRRGIRAIMLAEFAVKKTPLNMAETLKKRWLNEPETSIAKGFLNAFPPLVSMATENERAAWTPRAFSDPQEYRFLREFRFLITCLPCDERAYPTLENPNVIQGWTAISCSVIGSEKTKMIGAYGFILHAPAENIALADDSDVNVLNHLGTALTRNPNAEANMSHHEKISLLPQHLLDQFARHGLKSPSEMMSSNSEWNEVVVLGTNPKGFKTRVTGLFYRVDSKGNYYVGQRASKSPITAEIEKRVKQCSEKHNIPILKIEDTSGKNG